MPRGPALKQRRCAKPRRLPGGLLSAEVPPPPHRPPPKAAATACCRETGGLACASAEGSPQASGRAEPGRLPDTNQRHLGAPCHPPSAVLSPPKAEPECPQVSALGCSWGGSCRAGQRERRRTRQQILLPCLTASPPANPATDAARPQQVHHSVAEKHHAELRIWGMLSLPPNKEEEVSHSAPDT